MFSRSQARAVGVSDHVLGRFVSSGVVSRPYRGVFVLAGTPTDHRTHLRAALVAAGHDAAASHRSAAWMHLLIDRPPHRPQLTVRNPSRLALAGVELHRSMVATPMVSVDGIRCTSPLRTLVDLAAVAGAGDAELIGAIDRALHRRLVSPDRLARLAGEKNRRGSAALRQTLLGAGFLGGPEPSVLESKAARVFKQAGLPPPRVQVMAGPGGRYRIDFAYPSIRLAIECYGYAWHHSPEQMASDQRRQRQLVLEGWTVLVFTWRDIVYDPEGVAAEVAEARRRLTAG